MHKILDRILLQKIKLNLESNISMAKRILLVDDKPGFLRRLAAHYKAKGYEVETTGTLEQARAKLNAGGFERVVTDLMFPTREGAPLRPNGIEVAKMCKRKGIPSRLHSTTQNGPARRFLYRTEFRLAKREGFDVRPKRETMTQLRKARHGK